MKCKFRGKRADNGEWVYGYYRETCGYNCETLHLIHQIELSKCADYLVDSITVGQFIGLHDKYGKEIYEGDIVRTQECHNRPYSKNKKGKRHVGVVYYKISGGSGFYNRETRKWDIYRDWGAEWAIKINDMGNYCNYSWGLFWNCEVIGNIHDNPELIERNEK